MTGATQVKAYPGATPEQSQAMYAADSAQAAAMGWVPVSQAWDGATLIVTYAPALRAARPKKGRIQWAWVVVAVVAVMVLGGLASGTRKDAGNGFAHPSADSEAHAAADPSLARDDR